MNRFERALHQRRRPTSMRPWTTLSSTTHQGSAIHAETRCSHALAKVARMKKTEVSGVSDNVARWAGGQGAWVPTSEGAWQQPWVRRIHTGDTGARVHRKAASQC